MNRKCRSVFFFPFYLILAGITTCSPAFSQIIVGGKPFYEYDVVVATGDDVPNRPEWGTIVTVLPEMGLNDNGRLAVPVFTSTNAPAVVYENPVDGVLKSYYFFGIYAWFYHAVSYNNAGQIAIEWSSSLPDPRYWISSGIAFEDLANPYERAREMLWREEDDDPQTADISFPSLSDDGHIVALGRQLYNGWTSGDAFTNWVIKAGINWPTLSWCDYCVEAEWFEQLHISGNSYSDNTVNFPVVANQGVVAVQSGATNNGSVIRKSPGGTDTIATAPSEFAWLGSKVGMSDDGKVVTMFGERADGTNGLFVSIFDPGLYQLAPILALDKNFTIAVNETGGPIHIAEFDLQSAPLVVVQDRNSDGMLIDPAELEGDSILIAFMAQPTEASRFNPFTLKPMLFSDTPGIWVARFDVLRGMLDSNQVYLTFRTMTPVIQLGDQIDGQDITELYLAGFGRGQREAGGGVRRTLNGQPEQGDHVLAFWAKTATHEYAVKAYHLDTDGDGLLDHWERPGGGIDMDADGASELTLSEFGASDVQKDLFVELDWVDPRPSSSYPGGWINAPLRVELEDYAWVFFNAPVLSPNGNLGIQLHIDAGPDLSVNMEMAPLENLQGGDIVQRGGTVRPDVILITPNMDQLNKQTTVGAYEQATLHELKELYYGTKDMKARELAFRYCVVADFADLVVLTGGTGIDKARFRVVSADRRRLVAEAAVGQPLPSDGLIDGDYAGVFFTDGPAAGKVRAATITCPAGGIDGEPRRFELNVADGEPGFSILPAAGDYIMLTDIGTGGIAELFTWDNPPEKGHRLPGNDFIMSRGGFAPRRNRHLDTSLEITRTLVHEVGHTLGLDHGGRRGDCEFNGTNHFSIMSYSHVNRFFSDSLIEIHTNGCGSETTSTNIIFPPAIAATAGNPVESFSWGNDNVNLNEWDYLRMAPWSTFWMVGNAFNLRDGPLPLVHPRGGPYPRRPVNEMDVDGPRIDLPAPSLRTAATGSAFTVVFGAADPTGVNQVVVSFDLNGDGFVHPINERTNAVPLGGGQYQANLGVVSGSATGRLLRIHATDTLANDTYRTTVYKVGGASISDVTPPNIFFIDCCPQIASLSSPFEFRVDIYGEDTGPLDGVSLVECFFDIDGDGVTNDMTEVAAAGQDLDGYWRTRFRSLSGSPGTRRLRVVAEDMAGNRSTNSALITLKPPDLLPPQLITINITNMVVIPMGPGGFTLNMTASDDGGLSKAVIKFDSDGDGTNAIFEVDVHDWYFLETNSNFQLVIGSGGIAGTPGIRTIDVTINDDYGRSTNVVINAQVLDTQAPQISITDPVIEQIIRPGTNFAIAGSAVDDQRVTSVVVRVDLDGDGLFNSPGEVVSVDTNEVASFAAEFSAFTGANGLRRIRVEAADPLGQLSVQEFYIYVGPGVRVFSPLAGDTISIGQSVLAVIEAPGATNLVMSLDLNGDGDRLDVGESVTGIVRTVSLPEPSAVQTRVTEAVLGTVEGLPGSRDLVISGSDTNGLALNQALTLIVTNDAIFNASISRRLGGVPVYPNPVSASGPTVEPYPQKLIQLGSGVVYTARTPTEGESLWYSDGTKRGTRLLVQSNPERFTSGSGAGTPVGMGISTLMHYQGRIYFNASDKDSQTTILTNRYGNELWVTDGTADGTFMVKDINPFKAPSTESSDPGPFAVFSNRLYFGARHNTYGRELWVTDGSGTGTVMLADMSPGIVGTGPDQFVEMNGYLWFLVSKLALWRTDGTATGTVMRLELPPAGSIAMDKLAASGSRLYFEHNNGVNGWELWTTDGTETGTLMLADINPGIASANPTWLTPFSNKLYFAANSPATGVELWMTDGTTSGTKLVRDFWPGANSSLPRNFTIHNGRLWFGATTTERGEELWSLEGSNNLVRQEAEIAVVNGVNALNGNTAWSTGNPTSLLSNAGHLYLQARDGIGRYGAELHAINDGMSALIRDTAPMLLDRSTPSYKGPDHGYPGNLTRSVSNIFFRSYDSLYGNQLFVTDGTATGTRRLGGRVRTRSLPETVLWSNRPLFMALAGRENRWVDSNGQQLNAYSFTLPTGVTAPSNAVASSNGIAFMAQERDENGYPFHGVYAVPAPGASPVKLARLYEIWRLFKTGSGWVFTGLDTNFVNRMFCSDGTPGGTRVITNITSIYGKGFPTFTLDIGGSTIFNMSSVNFGEVWVSNGTTNGTRRVFKSGTSEHLRDGRMFTANGSRLGFFAYAQDGVTRFWTMTNILADALAGPELGYYGGYPVADVMPKVLGDRWVFPGISAYTNFPLWITDGTVTGTVGFGSAPSTSYPGGRLVDAPRRLFVHGSNVIFAAGYGFDGEELFASDCTAGGTRYLGNLYKLSSAGANPGSSPRQFTQLGSWVLFTAADKNRGEELWRTDGTEDGTIFIKDIFPGIPSSEISDMTNVGNRVYFTARTESGGRELWSTDGTAQGTLPVEDLMPGAGSSDPKALQSLSSNLLYFALDGSEDHSLRAIAFTNQPLTPYQQWLAGFSLPGGFSNEPWQDGDGDEWSNEMEYLFDTDPANPLERHPLKGVGIQMIVYPETISDYFVTQYTRPVNWQALGLWFQFEKAYYLSQFSPAAEEPVSVLNLGDMELVTVRFYTKDLCCPSSPRPDYFFIRLKVNRD